MYIHISFGIHIIIMHSLYDAFFKGCETRSFIMNATIIKGHFLSNALYCLFLGSFHYIQYVTYIMPVWHSQKKKRMLLKP